jgi:hypothetical protein
MTGTLAASGQRPSVVGRLPVPITATYRLDDAAQAFTDYGAGALGKLAVSVS